MRETSNETNVSLGFVNFYYGHTSVDYSLFENRKNFYYGMFYPKKEFSSVVGNNLSDANRIAIYDQGIDNMTNVGEVETQNLCDNIVLSNYDKYRVLGQGISGSIKPSFSEEMLLKANSFSDVNFYRHRDWDSNSFELNRNVFFEFENTNTSFLRVNRTNIIRDEIAEVNSPQSSGSSLLVQQANALMASKTNNSGVYDENYSSEGFSLKNGNRKRVGEFVEAFTNSQILSSSGSLGFIESKNLNRNQPQIYKPKSIGGYKITALDGKVYHYSLPVMNYEIWYKNYGNVNDEYANFVETEQKEPFATDWLLTAVTGPDYIDTNGNNVLDDADYGYWVEFDYGKWSDGYIWNGSSGKNDVVKNGSGLPDRYEIYRGRKQIYYLDAIKTRTHTAYFIKSLRRDAMGQNCSLYNNDNSPISWSSGENYYCGRSWDYNSCGTPLRTKSLAIYNVPTHNQSSDEIIDIYGNEMRYRYMRFPSHYSLKLDKIILVKNGDLIINKNRGLPLVSEKKAYIYENQAFNITKVVKREVTAGNPMNFSTESNGVYYSNPNLNTNEINIHQSENVIDKNDIEGNINLKALKIINFENDDYSLVLNSLNSSSTNKGRLTLKGIQMLGKEGVSYLPEYKFGYASFAEQFNSANEDDWGYNKNNPAAWSLNEIITPSGSKINITYEPDDYSFLASYSSPNPSNIGKGGGIRVKEISTRDEANLSYKVNYFYNIDGFNKDSSLSTYKSSGSLSFKPSKEKAILPYASELPAPIVMYGNVSVEEYGKNNEFLEGTNYKFETLENYQKKSGFAYNIGGSYLTIKKIQDEYISLGKTRFKKFEIKSFLNNLGRLKSIKQYNSKNQLLSMTSNQYSGFNDSENNNGVKEESFLSKSLSYSDYNAVSVSKTNYSSKLLSTKFLSSTIENTKYYDKYDFLTGQVLETRAVSSDGKSFKTKVVPAYLKYASMGSKVDNINNKNMLSQTAAEYSYILDTPTNTWKETGVGITTWNNEWTYKDIEGNATTPTVAKEKIWRKHKSYTWNGVKDVQGIFTNFNNTNDDGFNWALGVGSQPAQWKQTSEVTLYDHYSMLLEMKDINNNRAATKMGDNDTKIMASGNAGYNELFYTSGENLKNTIWLEPEVKMSGSAARTTTLAHTGKYAISTTSSSQLGVLMRNGQHKAGRYKMNVWVHKANAANARINYNATSYAFNGESYDAGDWTLKTHYIDNVPTTDFNVFVNSSDGTTVYYDDLMLRPVASSITGYVYNEWDELSYIVSNNGLATHFEYDAAGRLVKTSVEVLDDLPNLLTGGFKLKAENKQKYKNLP